MLAHVICCNDSIKAVVLEDEEFARSELEKLAKKDYKENRSNYNFVSNYKEYRELIYWHIHNVDVIIKKKSKKIDSLSKIVFPLGKS